MFKSSIAMITLLLLAGCTATPADRTATASGSSNDTTEASGQQVASASQTENTADDDELICKNERVVGSRLPRRVCGTQRQWDAMRSGSQETTRDVQRMPTGVVEEGG